MMKKVDHLEEELGDLIAQPRFKKLNELMEENTKLENQKERLEKVTPSTFS